jgi:chromosome segregation ATPase
MIAIIGSILGAFAGGGTITGILNYIRDRRRDQGDVVIGTFTSLKEMNALLHKQLGEVQTQLDNERTQRRGLEDELATERRARRALEERVAALERRTPDTDPGGPVA